VKDEIKENPKTIQIAIDVCTWTLASSEKSYKNNKRNKTLFALLESTSSSRTSRANGKW
jgi:hypothetical protein